jgi:sensor histidine kinase YesM
LKSEGREAEKISFWRKAFLVYVLLETVYFIINDITGLVICRDCVAPLSFGISQWFIHLLFTAFLWYSLYLMGKQQRWILITGNILVFLVYYFLWLAIAYWLLYVWGNWLLALKREELSFKSLVTHSWIEIGKYALKCTAFYTLQFYYDYRVAEQQRIQLAAINKDMQLSLLKQQLNPHFYFNTLNNLYGLARGNNYMLLPALQQLSNIMQYVLEDCNKPKVLLKQEIQFLESYIALEKLRYEQNTVIDMQVSGDVNGQTILPMMLIQFVENAFKHGMKEKTLNNWMKVKMDVERETLFFSVTNSYGASAVAEGIGISSVKHLLNLQYEGKYHLEMQQLPGTFSVTLKLNLV